MTLSYRTRRDGLEELTAFLEGFWDNRLEALRRAAERKEQDGNGSS